ncbi:HAMP domain-containing sensor histidine kinase [Methylosinus sp. LW4]|uniref:HAMP domain-containing sensor histidine kinase n=1 Tax=Methylosinus sp. LW4 TaxID=136993 RepID=UPI0003752038|nr:HAMP domain-containing sensor histidine kinase [Methylosinus sp. LW4]
MSEGPSLALRVATYLLAAQLVAVGGGWICALVLGLFGLEDFATSLDEIAYPRTREMVMASLTRDADGALRVEPTPALRAELARNPKLKYAVFEPEEMRPARGSAPELVTALTSLRSLHPSWVHFSLDPHPRSRPTGYLQSRETPYGAVSVGVHGFAFRWPDIFVSMYYDAKWMSAYFGPAILFSIVTSWFAVRHGLAPLRDMAAEAARIDMDSLEQRLPDAKTPAEVRPLVVAFNQALERLDAGAARLRRFTANAAHELRTPVAILTARLDAPKQPSFLVDLQGDAHRIRNIVEQLLATTRLSDSPARMDETVDLVASSRRVAADALLLAVQRGRQIEFEAPDSAVLVRGNRAAIESVLSNLVDNALRAEPEGGSVIVRVGADAGDGAVVAVIDHGEGIAEADRALIFEPFWRKSEAPPGTGLGLAIAKEVMTRLGGRIMVGDTEGGGATFTLAFRRPPRDRDGANCEPAPQNSSDGEWPAKTPLPR